MILIGDIEATGLDVTRDRVHCGVFQDFETGEVWEFRPNNLGEMAELLNKADKIVMHNGIQYDFPIMKNNGIIDVPFEKQVDTLVLSRLYYPDREGGHSVENWGRKLGYPKVGYDSWEEFDEDMLFRCKTDVEIQTEIYKALLRERGDHDWTLAEKIEHRIQLILFEQEQRGWKFRVERARELVSWLESEMERVANEVGPRLSLYYENKGEVKKPFVKSGNLSSIAEKWIDGFGQDFDTYDLDDLIAGPFGRIEWRSVSLSQREKLSNKLMEMGWKPTSYTETGRPQLTPDKQPCPNLQKLGDIGEKLSHYFLCAHRKGQIQGWVENCREDGRVPSIAIGNSTNTGRMAHRVIANVPKASEKVFLGTEMRDLFTHEEGYTLVGWDAEGLEMRVLAHYMNDPSFTEAVVNGRKEDKTDIHNLMLSASNGIIPDRDTTKNCLYALVYSAGDEKLGKTAGYTRNARSMGKKIRDAWGQRFPKLPKLVEQVSKASERGYLKSIDGRKVWMRRDPNGKVMSHKGLNTLIQSTGSIIVKTAVCTLDHWVKSKEIQAFNCIIYHDEDIAEILLDREMIDLYKELSHKAMKKTEELYNFRCPLSIEVKEGHSWGVVH